MKFIFLRLSMNKFVRVYLNDITHIGGNGDYVKIFTKDMVYNYHSSLNDIMEKINLVDDVFFRCHRSIVVNTNKIHRIQNHNIFVDGLDNNIPLSENNDNKKNLLIKLNMI